MEVLFDGELTTDYHQYYVTSGLHDERDPVTAAFAGQTNGLCGAAIPGFLFMTTALQYGPVGLTIERHDEEPPDPVDEWEDVVEVSFRPSSDTVSVVEWGGEPVAQLPLDQADYRVRCCAAGMDEARSRERRFRGEPQLDRYLLQFWPAPPAADRVVRQTSASAAYWHDAVRDRPPPPPPPPEVLAQDVFDTLLWGGVAPSERLRTLGANSYSLAVADRPLLDDLERLDPADQRAIARWAARRACDVSGLAALDWVAPALAAVEQGDDLPAPFDDQGRAWQLLLGDGTAVTNVHRTTTPPGTLEFPDRMDPQAAALPAVFAAVDTDPLRAAIDTIAAAMATFGNDYPVLLGELRAAFPQLGER